MKKIIWIVSFVPLLITLIVMQFLPSQVPMHFDLNGEVDRWGSKNEMLIFPVVILPIVLIFTLFILYFEKKQKNAEDEKEKAAAASNVKVFGIVTLATEVMFTAFQIYLLYAAYNSSELEAGADGNMINRITCILMGLLFIVMGNYVPKIRLNSSIGLRCTWSMYNDETWIRSNRFGGKVMAAAGAAAVVTALLVKNGLMSIALLMGYLTAAVIISLIYAHKVYKEETAKKA